MKTEKEKTLQISRNLMREIKLIVWFYANSTNWHGSSCMVGLDHAKHLYKKLEKIKS